jgi:peptide deformylase
MSDTKLPLLKIEGLEDSKRKSLEPNTSSFSVKTESKIHKGKILPLVAEEDPFLKRVSDRYDFENKYIDPITLTQSLIVSMRAYGGVGLSAIQVGYPLRVFVVGYEDQNQVFFNPEIISMSTNTAKMKEGCISYPFCFAMVERPEKIRIRFQDEKAEWHEKDFSGYTARIIQHEYDHLDGITLPDKVAKLTWKLLKDKSRKLYRKAVKQEARKQST